MFLPIKTEAHDGRFRFGALGIIVACLLIHLAILGDNSSHQAKVGELSARVSQHDMDKQVDKLIDDAGGQGVFDDDDSRRQKDSLAAEASAALDHERKSALFYKLALVIGDFNPVNLVTNLFVHADWLHLIFNMWFFYLVGVTMEKYWGMGKFLGLYFACGVVANLAFMLCSQGVKSQGVTLVGASGAIAGMMGAFWATHGDAKVTVMWLLGFRGGTFDISARVYLAFWITGQLFDGLMHMGQAGGTAYSAHIVGFAMGLLLGKKTKADAFYARAYKPDEFGAAIDRIVSGEKLAVESAKKTALPPAHQDGGEVITLLNQGRHAFEEGKGREGGALVFQALEKAFAIPALDPRILETALMRALETGPTGMLPPGALYAWGRKLEQIDWWQWAIRFYDACASDGSGGTHPHSRRNGTFRAAVLRQEHGYERDLARWGFQAIVGSDPGGALAEEAHHRLAALR